MNKYLKFEYWNTCDLGNIYYMGGQHFWFYLDGDVMEPFHEETEDGQENGDGDFIPTFRRGMKRYRIRTGLVPDYMVDAIQRMKLHDHIELTFKTGEIEQIYNVDVEMEWVFEKMCHQATVVLTFDMDEKIVIGACCDNLPIGEEEPEPEAIPDIYWIAANGDDSSGNGAYISPWKTLAYAASQPTVSGDIIHVKAGTYYETTQTVLAAGVSILGAGDTSIITTSTALDPIIVASSVSLTNGNQSISYVKFDGDLTAISCLDVHRRTNFKIHHCTFVDFFYGAIEFFGGSSLENIPATYATGNEIYSCTIDNCCERRDPGAFGAIRFGGQEGMLIHDNILTQTSRASTHNGNLLYMWGGTNKALKFYNNTCTKPTTDGVISGNAGGWNFHIESGHSHGYEIYNNTFTGGMAIDFAGGIQVKGDYDYSWWVHHNTFQITGQITAPAAGTHSPHGCDHERTNEDVVIEHNHFLNYPVAVNLTLSSSDYHYERIHYRYNIFENCGYSDGGYAYGAIQFVGNEAATGDLCTDFYIYNNVFHANGARGLIMLQQPYNIDNLYIRNNIFVDTAVAGWLVCWDVVGVSVTPTGTLDSIFVENNLLYNNANANAIYYRNGKAIVDLTYADNVVGSDPLFVDTDDFHLQAGSPAINVGMHLSLTEDYDGETVGNPPEIGAYEF